MYFRSTLCTQLTANDTQLALRTQAVTAPGTFQPHEYDRTRPAQQFDFHGTPYGMQQPDPSTMLQPSYQHQYHPQPSYQHGYQDGLGLMPPALPPQLSYQQQYQNSMPPPSHSALNYSPPHADSYYPAPTTAPLYQYPNNSMPPPSHSALNYPLPRADSSYPDPHQAYFLGTQAEDDIYQEDDDPQQYAPAPRVPDLLGSEWGLANALISRESERLPEAPTSAAGVPEHFMVRITPELISRWESSSITVRDYIYMLLSTLISTKSSTSRDVLAAHVSRRGGTSRPPQASTHRQALSSSALSESAGSSAWESTVASVTGQSSLTKSSALGVERTVRKRNRHGPTRRGPKTRATPLSDNDKINLEDAYLCFISAMCQHDCFPLPGQVKDDLVLDGCTQANSIATRDNRATSEIDSYFMRDVGYIFYSFDHPMLIISFRCVTRAQSSGRHLSWPPSTTCVNMESAPHRKSLGTIT